MTRSAVTRTAVRGANIADALLRPIVVAVQASLVILLFAIVFVTSVQVALRFAFSSSLLWSEEFVRFSFTWMILLSAALGLEMRAHFSVDVIGRLLAERQRLWLEGTTHVVVLAVSAYFLVIGAKFSANNWVQASDIMRIPMSVVYTSIPAAAAIMVLVSLRDILQLIGGSRPAAPTRATDVEI